MIATLNSFRDTLEELGGGLGVTDPVSGSGVEVNGRFAETAGEQNVSIAASIVGTRAFTIRHEQ